MTRIVPASRGEQAKEARRRRLQLLRQRQRQVGFSLCHYGRCTAKFFWLLIITSGIVILYSAQLQEILHFDNSFLRGVSLLSQIFQSSEVKCKYHGNCPFDAVCEDGLCTPYGKLNSTNSFRRQRSSSSAQQLKTCTDVCTRELTNDEYFYHGMEPMVTNSYLANNGHGCIIEFEGIKARNKPITTMDEWMQGRFRRVVRVDPGSEQGKWKALCDHPCESNVDCPPGTVCTGRPEQYTPTPVITSAPSSCRKPSISAEQTKQKDMVIVTGSDNQYFSALKNFAASVKYWAPSRKLVIYNLGMTERQLAGVQKWSNVYALHWKDGIPNSYPPHVHNIKNYAWKPIIINEAVHKYKSIFWLDAGATFTGPVDPIEEILHWNGVFLVRGQDDDMKALSHPETYKWFGFAKDTFRKGYSSPHYAGGIQGHVYPSRFIDSIVIPNAKCALDPSCISPSHSSLSNHRYDQTSLSILAYKAKAPHYTEYLAGGREQLNDLSRPTHRMIIWTARGGCSYYSQKVNLKR